MLTVQSVGETGLMMRFRRRFRRTAGVQVGIGDDAAVLILSQWLGHGRRAARLLMASDMLVEGVHFDRNAVAPQWIGWKALASNVSDLAAMGGRPCAAVVSLGLPRQTPLRFVDELSRGLERCAKRFGLAIVGGDTVRAPRVVIDVTVLGYVRPEHVTLRSTARVGDLLFVTGRLGGSLLSGRHARVTPRLREAQWLVSHLPVHAMIDLSDGLASDLWQIARASRVTLRIEANRVPIAAEACPPTKHARTFTRRVGAKQQGRRQGLQHALMDGEDFELLFTVPRRATTRVPRRIGRCPVTHIGEVVGRGVQVQLQDPDGHVRPLRPGGFKHF